MGKGARQLDLASPPGSPGSIAYGNGEPQEFTRVLNYEAPVGLKIAPGSINPTWQLAKNVLTVSYLVVDKAGNHASPALTHASVLRVNGSEVAAGSTNDYSATYVLSLNIEAEEFRLSADGKKVIGGAARVALKNGKNSRFEARRSFQLAA